MVDEQKTVQNVPGTVKENNVGKRHRILKEKIHIARNSLLTDLFREKQSRTIYFTFVAISLCLCTNALVESFTTEQRYVIGFRFIINAFKSFHLAALVWLALIITVFWSFKCFKIWAEVRLKLKDKYWKQSWDRLWIFILASYYITVLYFISKCIWWLDLPFVMATALEADAVRLLMKVHSFVRNSSQDVIHYCNSVKNEKDIKLGKHFSKFFYFLFAPTLIYKDEYPRTRTINWSFVLISATEFVFCGITIAIVLDTYVIRPFEDIATNFKSIDCILFPLLRCNFAGIIVMLYAFYMVFHAFQNIFAELTRFADREFYQDWWCSSDILQYFKTWNVLVYNWLFLYVYRDIYENVCQNKEVAKVMVVLISAVIHEIMLSCCLRMFFPFLFFAFFTTGAITTWCNIKNKTLAHIVSKFMFFWGSGFLLTAYSIEYSVRNYLPSVNSDNLSDYIFPKSILLVMKSF